MAEEQKQAPAPGGGGAPRGEGGGGGGHRPSGGGHGPGGGHGGNRNDRTEDRGEAGGAAQHLANATSSFGPQLVDLVGQALRLGAGGIGLAPQLLDARLHRGDLGVERGELCREGGEDPLVRF